MNDITFAVAHVGLKTQVFCIILDPKQSNKTVARL